MVRVARFLREYARPDHARVACVEATYQRGAETLPASVYTPVGLGRPLPAFVVLHGLTATARDHPGLIRFARAMSASGALVLVPEIPEWRDLRVAPAITIPTIRAAVHSLAHRDDILPGGVGILGFSFGATQALVAASGGALAGEVRAISAWGGYRDVHRLFHFGVTGEFGLNGERRHMAPDPYGRWLIAGNYLTGVPGYGDATATARAAHDLALEAGRSGVYAGDAAWDPVKARLRATLPPAEQPLFDLIAPPVDAGPGGPEAARLAAALADAALAADPLLDPGPSLAAVSTPTLLAHGRDDRLIPFTELHRLAAALPAGVVKRATVTALFAHSGGATPGLGPWGLAREAVRFVRHLRHLLDPP